MFRAVDGIDVVVAREDVAVVLHRQTLAAEFRGDAALRGQAQRLRDRGFEEVDVHATEIVGVPIVPDRGEEGAPVVGSTDQSVTTESGAPGFACGVPTRGSFAGSQCCGATLRNATGSTPEISCTRQAPNSRVRKR